MGFDQLQENRKNSKTFLRNQRNSNDIPPPDPDTSNNKQTNQENKWEIRRHPENSRNPYKQPGSKLKFIPAILTDFFLELDTLR